MRDASCAAVYALFCLIIGSSLAIAQQTASVSGFVTDQQTGETLILSNVVIQGTSRGAATNTAGFYVLSGLQPGTYPLVFSYIGYQEQVREVTLEAGEELRLDVALLPDDVMIDEIVVSAESDLQQEIKQIGVAQLEAALVRSLPAVLEPDVFRSLQLLPGVKAASDFSSGLYIRGGSPDQTLVLLDRTSVYNPSHFFGLFSTFNPDAIKDVRLYKGGYPAEYGGRLGSVVDIYNKDGNRNEVHGGLSVGLLASRVLLEGPLPKGSWMLAARRSTLEPLLNAINNSSADVTLPESFYFYDLNGKINVDATENNKFSLAFYAGTDDLDFPFLEDARVLLNYGNQTISGNWTHIFSGKLFSNFTATGSHYRSDPRFDLAGTEFARVNDIYDISLKGDLEYLPSEKHTLEAGYWFGNLTFKLTDTFDGLETLDSRIQSVYGAAYLQESYRPVPEWNILGGVRANYFGEGDFWRLEPRLTVEYQPREAIRYQVGYGRYYQFLTLITSEAFAGFDLWLTTDDGVPPSSGDQFVAGLKSRVTPTTNVDFEVYYRTMNNLFRLDPFINDAAGLDYADLFQFGEGYAYGAEVLIEKPAGRLNGFLGYTFGITRRRFPDINVDETGTPQWYSPKYDRTHDINLVANYDLSRRWRATGVFTYGTGQAYTKPVAQYRLGFDPFGEDRRDVLISPFNNARLPAYHRLDLGVSNIGPFFGIGDYELQLQVINAYSRRNIWFIFNEFESDGSIDQTDIPQIPIPIPNLSFSLRF